VRNLLDSYVVSQRNVPIKPFALAWQVGYTMAVIALQADAPAQPQETVGIGLKGSLAIRYPISGKSS